MHLTVTTLFSEQGLPRASTTTDVLQYSTAPLPASVFEPPAGYKRIGTLPGQFSQTWTDRLQSDWQQLTGAVGSWFE